MQLTLQPSDLDVSIRAAGEGGDVDPLKQLQLLGLFQSAPPVKAATQKGNTNRRRGEVSIRAAGEGGDCPPSNC